MLSISAYWLSPSWSASPLFNWDEAVGLRLTESCACGLVSSFLGGWAVGAGGWFVEVLLDTGEIDMCFPLLLSSAKDDSALLIS
jgi:hypothetical protein